MGDPYAYRIDLAQRHFARQGRVLDVGCGSGDWAARMLSLTDAREVHGVDVIDGCSANIAFRLYDGERLPYEDAYFDSILVFSVLHHTRDPSALVREISRVCRPGGRVMIVEDIAASRLQTWLTGACDWYSNRVDNFVRALRGLRRWATTRVPMTWQYRSYPEWLSLFRRHDLHVLEMTSVPHQLIEHGVFVLERRGS